MDIVPNASRTARILGDGNARDRWSHHQTGSFKFRLTERAKYRVSVKADGAGLSAWIEVDGAAVYRVALVTTKP